MAGSTSVSREQREISKGGEARRCEVVTINFTADASDGSVPNTDLVLDGFLVKVVTNPGSTAPTDNWDIVINDAEGVDVAGGALTNRDTTNSEQVYPLISGAVIPVFVAGSHTMVISGNSVNSATGKIVLYLVDGM